jgi:hypothetical protein
MTARTRFWLRLCGCGLTAIILPLLGGVALHHFWTLGLLQSLAIILPVEIVFGLVLFFVQRRRKISGATNKSERPK